MASVCFYFQLHQPYRLRRYSVFDSGPDYFDADKNAEILQKVASRCYLPAGRLLLEMIREYEGRFRIAYSITGVLLEQLAAQAPEVIALFRELAATGCVEFLCETYHHSLAFLYSKEEFRQQVEMHQQLVRRVLGQTPRVFRNTELVYNNDLAQFVAHMGFDAILSEGADHVLGPRSPNLVYQPPGVPSLKLLLKNYRLSDDIAFRFSNHAWEQYPLTAEKFARWISQINGNGQVCNLFLDYETFGEHQWAETGIFEFLKYVPREVLRDPANDFLTPSQVVDRYDSAGEMSVPGMISWADSARDLSAWIGNAMQSNAMLELFKIESLVKQRGDEQLLEDWRRLTTSDHFYYMCTKFWADGAVHKYFSPFESPYDSYINFMNVLDNLRVRCRG